MVNIGSSNMGVSCFPMCMGFLLLVCFFLLLFVVLVFVVFVWGRGLRVCPGS